MTNRQIVDKWANELKKAQEQEVAREEQIIFSGELTLLRDKAIRLGLYATSQLLHEAVREVGWEIQGKSRPGGTDR